MKSFQTRIVLLFSALLLGVQSLILTSAYWVSRNSVVEQLDRNLAYAERFFNRALTEHGERIAGETRLLVADFGFRTAVSQDDARTLDSALENLAYRTHVQRAFYVDLNGSIVADTAGRYRQVPFMFPAALQQAEARGRAVVFGLLEDELYEWAIVPVLAPIPVGWVAVALTVDRGLVSEFRHLSTLPLEISLAESAPDRSRLFASSFDPARQALLAGRLLREPVLQDRGSTLVELGDDTFMTRWQRLPGSGAAPAILAILQINLADALKPYVMLMSGVFVLMVAGLVASLVGSLWVARRLARPVRDLASATERFMEGGPVEPLPVTRQDEIGQLAETFNRAARMAAQLGDLEQKDQQRRELMATVSHDLRTPLTSLHGYLETLQHRAGRLPAEDHRQFLEVALRQTEQVSRLARELFELAKLECDEGCVRWEDFCLAELVQDVTQKYRLAAQQRGIGLSAGLRPGLPTVRADIGLIERVLTNLIDNALKHTPAGGEVRVDAERDGARIAVTVADSGIGIAPEFLPKLFQWDSPLIRRSGRHTGGLGLIVVAKILGLHGSTITVDSEPGRGSTFRFALAQSGAVQRTADG
jgi:signal transduction histidine kinase